MQRPRDEGGRPLSRRRLLENEQLSRRLNRKVEELDRVIAASDRDARGASAPGFFCECSNADCLERLPLDHEEYDRVHARPDLFTVAPGHEVPEVETVEERWEGWSVVRKHTLEPTD